VFTIRNSGGDIVRQIEAPVEAGFHRVAWDLRYPALQPWSPESEGSFFGNGGVLVAPGTFSVTMQERVDGVLSDVVPAQTFQVTSIRPEPTLPGSTQEQRVVFEMQADELTRAGSGTVAAIDEFITELDAVKETLERATTDGSLYEIAHSIQQRLREQRDRLEENPQRSIYNDVGEMTLGARLWHARFTPTGGAYGPTPEQRESLRIARELYDRTVSNLNTLEREYATLKAAMDTAKVPWTPGRGIQD
jgi:hypothetical protein